MTKRCCKKMKIIVVNCARMTFVVLLREREFSLSFLCLFFKIFTARADMRGRAYFLIKLEEVIVKVQISCRTSRRSRHVDWKSWIFSPLVCAEATGCAGLKREKKKKPNRIPGDPRFFRSLPRSFRGTIRIEI